MPGENFIALVKEFLGEYGPLIFGFLLIAILVLASGGSPLFMDLYFTMLALASGTVALNIYKTF